MTIATILSKISNDEVAAKLPPVLIAVLLGLFICGTVAFAQPSEIHNAAHDGRHVFAVPCH